MSTILVAGAAGFIGRHLCAALAEKGCRLRIVTRDADKAKKILGNNIQVATWQNLRIADSDAVINLAGENVGNGRWTARKKEKIMNSRLRSLDRLIDAFRTSPKKPGTFIQASAIGYYGDGGDKLLDESAGLGREFLSGVVSRIEERFSGLQKFNVRCAAIRTAVVLGKDGGALPRMVEPFKYGIGGVVGSGQEYISWIHIDDEVGAIIYLLENMNLSGSFNLSSPNPLKSSEFYKTIGKVLKKPSFMKLPPLAIKMLLGQKGEELLLSSKRVVPKRLLEAGFKFKYSDLKTALTDIL